MANHPNRSKITRQNVVAEIEMRRPDLLSTAAGDAVSAVLMAQPGLSATQVIEILDASAAEHDVERADT